jgi:hypothetical protein
VLGLEVLRLARNNADWHRLVDLAGLTDTAMPLAANLKTSISVRSAVAKRSSASPCIR